jgi:hypothetical protein
MNVCHLGLYVQANDVVAYGLFCEHSLKENCLWEGNDGRLYLYQCELPYKVATKSWDFAGLKVTGSNFSGHGIGVYCFFPDGTHAPTNVTRAVQTPDDAVLENVCTVFLNGTNGGIGFVLQYGTDAQSIHCGGAVTEKGDVSVVCSPDATGC